MNNTTLHSPPEVDVAFNAQFANIDPNLAFEIPANDIPPESYSTLHLPIQPFRYEILSVNKVQKLLKELDAKKATGLDNIPCNLLKLAANIVALSIQQVNAYWNLSIRMETSY